MKKFLFVLSCCLLVIFGGTFISGCSFAGKSAYDIAVENGFKGTEAEWLESLKGKDVGKSAYDIAVEHGFEGTEEEWLKSLKGEKGDDGDDGDDGFNGQDGKDGEDGADLTIGALFDKAVEYGLYTDDAAGYAQFLSDYFSGNIGDIVDTELVANKCLNQAVSIYCRNRSGYLSAGSGVFYNIDRVNKEAYIITNYHVVSCYDETTQEYYVSDNIKFYLYGEETIYSSGSYVEYGDKVISAEYIGGSANYDLAVIKVSGEEFLKIKDSCKEVTFADSNQIRLGETAIAIGNPMGAGISVNSGVVSVDSEEVLLSIAGAIRQLRVLRCDTSVNAGNSGGGLFNNNCELIGIINAKKRDNIDSSGNLTTYDGVNYALPSTYVKNVVENIIYFYNAKYQEGAEDNSVGVHKYLIGLTITIENPRNEYNEVLNTHNLKEDTVVVEVTEDSTASNIGFMVGDIIKCFKVISNDDSEVVYSINRRHELMDNSLKLRLGDRVIYTVIRTNAETGDTYEVDLVEFTVSYDGYAEYKNEQE